MLATRIDDSFLKPISLSIPPDFAFPFLAYANPLFDGTSEAQKLGRV